MAILGETMTNDLRGQIARRAIELNAVDRQGPAVLIPGVVEFGRPYAGDGDHRQSYLEAGDTLGYAAGPHFFRIGGDVMRIAAKGRNRDGMGGLYLFRSVDAFVRGEPDSYRQTFGDPPFRSVLLATTCSCRTNGRARRWR